MERSTRDPDDWLAALPEDVRAAMQRLDALLSEGMAGLPRTLWEGVFWGGTTQAILGYGDLRTTRSDGRAVDWFMVGLARQSRRFSLYVNAVEAGRYVVQAQAARLGKVKVGSACIGFTRIEQLDVAALQDVLAIARAQCIANRGVATHDA